MALFSTITTTAENNKVSAGIVTASVGAGVFFGIYKKSSFLGTFGYAIGFGIGGLALAMAVSSYTN